MICQIRCRFVALALLVVLAPPRGLRCLVRVAINFECLLLTVKTSDVASVDGREIDILSIKPATRNDPAGTSIRTDILRHLLPCKQRQNW
jgi:hypothetical protein